MLARQIIRDLPPKSKLIFSPYILIKYIKKINKNEKLMQNKLIRFNQKNIQFSKVKNRNKSFM